MGAPGVSRSMEMAGARAVRRVRLGSAVLGTNVNVMDKAARVGAVPPVVRPPGPASKGTWLRRAAPAAGCVGCAGGRPRSALEAAASVTRPHGVVATAAVTASHASREPHTAPVALRVKPVAYAAGLKSVTPSPVVAGPASRCDRRAAVNREPGEPDEVSALLALVLHCRRGGCLGARSRG